MTMCGDCSFTLEVRRNPFNEETDDLLANRWTEILSNSLHNYEMWISDEVRPWWPSAEFDDDVGARSLHKNIKICLMLGSRLEGGKPIHRLLIQVRCLVGILERLTTLTIDYLVLGIGQNSAEVYIKQLTELLSAIKAIWRSLEITFNPNRKKFDNASFYQTNSLEEFRINDELVLGSLMRDTSRLLGLCGGELEISYLKGVRNEFLDLKALIENFKGLFFCFICKKNTQEENILPPLLICDSEISEEDLVVELSFEESTQCRSPARELEPTQHQEFRDPLSESSAVENVRKPRVNRRANSLDKQPQPPIKKARKTV